jgi:hypothetical protein
MGAAYRNGSIRRAPTGEKGLNQIRFLNLIGPLERTERHKSDPRSYASDMTVS